MMKTESQSLMFTNSLKMDVIFWEVDREGVLQFSRETHIDTNAHGFSDHFKDTERVDGE